MKGLEDYFSVGRKTMAVGGLILLLTSCETIRKLPPVKVAEEVVKMAYKIAALPFPSGKGPFVTGCIGDEDSNERVCKLHLRKKIDTDPDVYEEYFGVLDIKIKEKKVDLVLGYYDGDMENMDGEKTLTVVEYRGEKREDFVTPRFGKMDYLYSKFTNYFGSIKVKKLDTSENPLKEVMDKGLMNMIKLNIFKKRLHNRIGEGLKLLDEKPQK